MSPLAGCGGVAASAATVPASAHHGCGRAAPFGSQLVLFFVVDCSSWGWVWVCGGMRGPVLCA